MSRSDVWPISSRSARAAAGCRCSTCSAATRASRRVTLIEPDVYKPHNVERHLFPLSAVGERKAVLAERWLQERRPDLDVRPARLRPAGPGPPGGHRRGGRRRRHRRLRRRQRAGQVSLGRPDAPPRQTVDARRSAQRRHRRLRPLVRARRPLLRLRGQPFAAHRRAWTKPRRRTTPTRAAPCTETTIPASKASIHAIASLHALVTLGLLDGPGRLCARLHEPVADLAAGAGRLRGGLSALPLPCAARGGLLDLPAATDAVLGGGTRCGPGSSAGATGR